MFDTVIPLSSGERVVLRQWWDGPALRSVCPVCNFPDLWRLPYDWTQPVNAAGHATGTAVGAPSFDSCPICSTVFGISDSPRTFGSVRNAWAALRRGRGQADEALGDWAAAPPISRTVYVRPGSETAIDGRASYGEVADMAFRDVSDAAYSVFQRAGPWDRQRCVLHVTSRRWVVQLMHGQRRNLVVAFVTLGPGEDLAHFLRAAGCVEPLRVSPPDDVVVRQLPLWTGQVIEIRQAWYGVYFCPVCGWELTEAPYSWGGEAGEDMPEGVGIRPGGAYGLPSGSQCHCCFTTFGEDDLGRFDVSKRWAELRHRWLEAVDWSLAALQQLEANLGIDTRLLDSGKTRP